MARSWALVLLLSLSCSGLLCSGLSCSGMTGAPPVSSGPGQSLLRGKNPSISRGVTHIDRLTDGVAAETGNFWRTEVTAVLGSAHAFAVYDLGKSVPVRCALVQGDNNDVYRVTISDDGKSFAPLWEGKPAPGAGMRTRTGRDLGGQGRYLRLSADGGDGSYSVGEFAVYQECPAEWPPTLSTLRGTPLDEAARGKIWLFGLVAMLFLLINGRQSSDFVRLLVVVPIGLGISLVVQLVDLWPLDENEQTLLRLVVAVLAATAILREMPWRGRFATDKRWTTGTLAVLSLVSVSCFYHLGAPQFRDESKGRLTLVHPWDMRVYFPVAKYFKELKFDGLYLASVAAYLDNNNVTPDKIARVRLRDLRDNHMRAVSEVVPEIEGVRTRFSTERWQEFRKDMAYFQGVMGPNNYLGSLQDHGGNATPVWILGAHLLYRSADASELTLTLTGLLDPLLLVLTFFFIGRTFGLRVMLLVMILFGATDYSRFGTNLMGSTLRADWMAAVGLGACAFRLGRPMLAGGLMAYAGLVRAFPALATFFMVVPGLWWLIEKVIAERKFPPLRVIWTEQRAILRAVAGAFATVAVLVAISSAVFGFSDSWGTWAAKIKIHHEKPNTNHVGMRNLAAFQADKTGQRLVNDGLAEPWTKWQEEQLEAFGRRRPLYYGGIAVFVGLALAACRRRRPEQAALIGLTLIPVFFYPANYYCHYVFLLPLMATASGGPHQAAHGRLYPWVALVLLAMCVAQYPTLSTGWSDVIYTWQSVILLLGFAAILAPMAWDTWRRPRPDEVLAASTLAAPSGQTPTGSAPAVGGAPATTSP